METEPSGLKKVNYAGLIGPLIEAVKELDARVRSLERQLETKGEQDEEERGSRRSSEVEGHTIRGHARSEDESDDEDEGGDQGDKGRFASDARLKREIWPLGEGREIFRGCRLGQRGRRAQRS